MGSLSMCWPVQCWQRPERTTLLLWRAGVSEALPSFNRLAEAPRAAIAATRKALWRVTAARNRLLATRARSDTRAWQVKRRERTRHLVELGGLVAKAGLIDLTDDDRVVMFGLFVEAAATLRSDRRDEALALWRRRGRRAFEAHAPGI